MRTELSLYIHIPFCVSKCKYCDFLSYRAGDEAKEAYIRTLLEEIRAKGEEYKDREVISVYIGGGTPSCLAEGAVSALMEAIGSSFGLRKDAEITIEVNPKTADGNKLKEYFGSGINRLSIGLQSANDAELELLGRAHTYRDFEETYFSAREAGFKNINADIISAIPGQQAEDYLNSLNKLCALRPEHISSYSLQLEEGTYFFAHRDEYLFPDEELDRELYYLTEKVLSDAGYERYEISNYSLPGYASRHNSVYWRGGDYLGLGLGASSLIEGVRFSNPAAIRDYGTKGYVDIQRLTRNQRMEEFMFLGLRLLEGVEPEEFRKRFGRELWEVYGEPLEELKRDKLIIADKKIRLTPLGVDVSNYVFEKFLL